jgi:hypothetical protein
VPAAGDGQRISVVEAATRLGISERAVRKRIAAGTLHAVREDGRWLVSLPDGADVRRPTAPSLRTAPSRTTPSAPAASGGPAEATEAVKPAGGGARQTPEASPTVPADHASDLLRMIRDLQQQNLELAGQVGFLQARLASVQDQLLLAEASEDAEPEPEPAVAERRSLLDRLLGR